MIQSKLCHKLIEYGNCKRLEALCFGELLSVKKLITFKL